MSSRRSDALSRPPSAGPADTRALARLMEQAADALERPATIPESVPIKVGVDLGTAFTVVVVTDESGCPLAAATVFADVVRDGIVWDFAGAQKVVRDLKRQLEEATGRELSQGSVTIPPAVTRADHRAHRYVIEGAGIACTAVVDETTAANSVLGVVDGAVVDIGGGTTGVAILQDGDIVANIDEPTGGTHLSLVIAGAYKIPFEQAESRKRSPQWQPELLSVVRPTLEKVATIVGRAIKGHSVDTIHLVGGTAAFPGIADIMTDITGVPSLVAPQPMLVTPLGATAWAEPITRKGGR